MFQTAGKMEEFFRELGKYNSRPYVHDALSLDELRRLFRDYGMDLLGAPLVGEWKVEQDGRITRIAEPCGDFPEQRFRVLKSTSVMKRWAMQQC